MCGSCILNRKKRTERRGARFILDIERSEQFSEILPVILWILQLQIIVKLLFFQLLNGLDVKILEHGVEIEEGLDLLFVGEGVDHEVEVVEGEVLAEVCMFLEDEDHAVKREDGLEDVEVLGEEQEALDVQFGRADRVELGVLLGWLDVDATVVVVDVGQTALHLRLAQHHRLFYLRGGSGALLAGVIDRLGQGGHELFVIVLEYFPLFILLALHEHAAQHLLLDLVDPLLGVEVLCHYKIIIALQFEKGKRGRGRRWNGSLVLQFYIYTMVIRHHLALQDYQNHDPASDKSATSSSPSQDVQPPASSGPPVNTKAAASSTSKTDTASGSTKTSSTTSSPPPQNGASATPSSKSTTSPSNLKDSKNNSPPPPSTPESTATKSSAAPASSSNSSTKSSSTPPPAPTPSPTPAASSKSLSSSPPATSNSTSSSSSSSSSSQSLVSGGRFLGIEISFLIDLGIVLAIIAIIIIIIVILYRRYQTRKDYNESPQIFAHKPNLGFNEEYHLNHSKIEKCLTPEKITIEEQNLLSGKLYQVEFKGTEKSAVYFHRRQSTTAYFEIEVLQANGSVEIGFIPCTSFQKLKNGEENMGSAGVGVNNSGFVQAEGENVYNYSWTLAFGDVFGIGLTKESSKFSQRRAWISKNGVLLNFPPNDEMDKWLATIEISVEQKNEYNIGTEKKEGEQEEEDQEDEQKMKEKAQRQKVEGLLKKQRISLKTFNKFQYYPVIVCHGNKDDSKPTVINVNVGGQIFRMYDTQFRSGLLRDKPLFGDD